jgi:thioredoxin 1
MAKHVTDADFKQEVLESDMPVLVDFWAEWCGPCKAVAPMLDELSIELANKVKIVKLNVDENPATMSQFGVRSIPTMIIFKNGEPVDMKVGAGPKAAMSQWLQAHV